MNIAMIRDVVFSFDLSAASRCDYLRQNIKMIFSKQFASGKKREDGNRGYVNVAVPVF